ncbi:MAG: hypothetical protein IJ408_01625 [Clostridia bacterium]|nr:hypothetical protein [Clostridia bacterium]
MGLFGALAGYALNELLNSNDDIAEKVKKAQYNDAVHKRSVLIDAQVKAHASGNTKAEKQIKDARKEVQSTIKSYEEEQQMKRRSQNG